MKNSEQNFGEFRDYKDSKFQDRVRLTYRSMHMNQSVDYVREMKACYFQLNHGKMDVYQVFKLLEEVIDESDPDTDLPQIEHAYQTAEAVTNRFICNDSKIKGVHFVKGLFRESEWQSLPKERRRNFEKHTLESLYPHIKDWSWLSLTGFIHDMGKVMLLPKFGQLAQWSVVGDTYPVGAPFSKENVFYDSEFYKESIDYPKYANETEHRFGRYAKYCGFDNIDMSWGHDEYIYKVMKEASELPEESLYLLRYHSFYSWHTPQTGSIGYQELASEKDWYLLPLLKVFQKADLYSKLPELSSKNLLEEKYKHLLNKYIPVEKIAW